MKNPTFTIQIRVDRDPRNLVTKDILRWVLHENFDCIDGDVSFMISTKDTTYPTEYLGDHVSWRVE